MGKFYRINLNLRSGAWAWLHSRHSSCASFGSFQTEELRHWSGGDFNRIPTKWKELKVGNSRGIFSIKSYPRVQIPSVGVLGFGIISISTLALTGMDPIPSFPLLLQECPLKKSGCVCAEHERPPDVTVPAWPQELIPAPRKRGLKTQEKLFMPVQFFMFKLKITPS